MLRSREADNSYERKLEKITLNTMLQGGLFEDALRSTTVVKSRFETRHLQTVILWPDGAMFSDTVQEDWGATLWEHGSQCRGQEPSWGAISLYMDMCFPSWKLLVPGTKAGVGSSWPPETRLTSVWGRRYQLGANWEPGATSALRCSSWDAQAPSLWVFCVLLKICSSLFFCLPIQIGKLQSWSGDWIAAGTTSDLFLLSHSTKNQVVLRGLHTLSSHRLQAGPFPALRISPGLAVLGSCSSQGCLPFTWW